MKSPIRDQLYEQRRKVDFDAYDISAEELVRRIEGGRIDIAPTYQRRFRWEEERQSTLIESLLLGIPIPNLFMATNALPDRPICWEMVDGLQRSLTIVNFIGEDSLRDSLGMKGPKLKLTGLTKLTELNGLTFSELPDDLQTLLLDRPLKVTVLNDKSDRQVRFDLFERLNTGGIILTDQEVRECIFRGPFIDMLKDLSCYVSFEELIHLSENNQNDGTKQEYVLRFFAYLDRYKQFDHSVKDFLNSYTEWAVDEVGDDESRRETFKNTFDYLAKCFPNGIYRNNRKNTPVNYYEGIAVGAALALAQKPDLPPSKDTSWTESDIYKKATSAATNSRPQVTTRIEFARDSFLNNE